MNWVVVCKDLKLEKVQDDIGRKMGLIGDSWNNKSIEDKAQDIFKVLRKKKFVLLLDDIREAIDLNKVGVPLPSSNIASKVIFATRSKHVCGKMEAQRKFRVFGARRSLEIVSVEGWRGHY